MIGPMSCSTLFFLLFFAFHLPVGHLLFGRQRTGVLQRRDLCHPEIARPNHVHTLSGLEMRAPHVPKHGHLSVTGRVFQYLRAGVSVVWIGGGGGGQGYDWDKIEDAGISSR